MADRATCTGCGMPVANAAWLDSPMHYGYCAPPGGWPAKVKALEAEVERLRAVLRSTHDDYCTEEWSGRGLHAPECLLAETEES